MVTRHLFIHTKVCLVLRDTKQTSAESMEEGRNAKALAKVCKCHLITMAWAETPHVSQLNKVQIMGYCCQKQVKARPYLKS